MSIPIKIIKPEQAFTFLVIVGTAIYEMSRDADMPNGVCIYSGETTDPQLAHIEQHGVRYIGDISQGMMRQIAKIVELFSRGEAETTDA